MLSDAASAEESFPLLLLPPQLAQEDAATRATATIIMCFMAYLIGATTEQKMLSARVQRKGNANSGRAPPRGKA
jgi:hypothetical protein